MTHDFVEIAWKSVITSGLALLLLTLLRNRSAAERSWIAHAGLVATLLLPLAVFNMPRWQVEAPTSMPDVFVAQQAPGFGVSAVSALPEAAGQEAGAGAAAAGSSSFNVDAVMPWFYGLPAALLLLVMLVAVIRLFALRSRAAVLVEPSWLSALAHAQRRMGFKHGTALLVSNELASPVSWGILRPIILLNEGAVKSASEAEAIIAHELAHVARLDWAKLLIARAATALFWFNPLVWLLARQCHQLREEAADDAVLRADVVSTDYAALLVGAARHESKGLLLAANGVAPGPGSLKRRVTRVLNGTLSRRPARMAWATACSVGAIIVAAPLSALAPVGPIPSPAVHFFTGTKAGLANAQPQPSKVVLPQPGTTLTALTPPAAAGAGPAAAITISAVESATPAIIASAAPSPSPLPSPAPQAARAPRASGLIDPDTLIRMATHGVTPEYMASLAAADPKLANLSLDEMVKMRIHGVTADKIRTFAAMGYPNLGADQLRRMSIHGVTPDYVRSMAALGYAGLSADQLVKMRIHGVSEAYIRQFRAAGYKDLTAEELTKMRIHGVTPPNDP